MWRKRLKIKYKKFKNIERQKSYFIRQNIPIHSVYTGTYYTLRNILLEHAV